MPCLESKRDPLLAYDYTAKGNLVAVISDVAGLHDRLEFHRVGLHAVNMGAVGAMHGALIGLRAEISGRTRSDLCCIYGLTMSE